LTIFSSVQPAAGLPVALVCLSITFGGELQDLHASLFTFTGTNAKVSHRGFIATLDAVRYQTADSTLLTGMGIKQ
jgi:hypothetical protein